MASVLHFISTSQVLPVTWGQTVNIDFGPSRAFTNTRAHVCMFYKQCACENNNVSNERVWYQIHRITSADVLLQSSVWFSALLLIGTLNWSLWGAQSSVCYHALFFALFLFFGVLTAGCFKDLQRIWECMNPNSLNPCQDCYWNNTTRCSTKCTKVIFFFSEDWSQVLIDQEAVTLFSCYFNSNRQPVNTRGGWMVSGIQISLWVCWYFISMCR